MSLPKTCWINQIPEFERKASWHKHYHTENLNPKSRYVSTAGAISECRASILRLLSVMPRMEENNCKTIRIQCNKGEPLLDQQLCRHAHAHTHTHTYAHAHARTGTQAGSLTHAHHPDLCRHVGREYGNPGNPCSRVVSDLCGPITQVIHLITGEGAESIVGAAIVNE